MRRKTNVTPLYGWIIICLTVFLGVPDNANALTFHFDRSQTGVREIVNSYVRFSAQGREITAVLPPIFYMVTTHSEEDTVLVAKVGSLTGKPKLTATLNALSGKLPKTLKGPHGETLFSRPKSSPKVLSAYALWGEWLFVARNKEALLALLKRSASPQAVVTPPSSFISDGLPAAAGIRFWGGNDNGDLTNILKEGQTKVWIPLIKDPAQVARVSGVFQPNPGRKLSVQMTIIPSSPRHVLSLKGDLKFVNESIRRRLTALQIPYVGNVTDKNGRLEINGSVGDYLKAKSGLVKSRT